MEPLDRPASLVRNLRKLVEIDLDFGIEDILAPASEPPAAVSSPRPERPAESPAAPAPARSAQAPAGVPSARSPSGKPATAEARVEPSTLEAWPEPDFGGDAGERLAAVAEGVARCVRCDLASTRHNPVPGEGNPKAEIMFVGEGPGAEEDDQGRPFVGAAGQLLDKMIAAMGLARDEVFITNIVKCRPPHNRNPSHGEACTCGAWLAEQIAAISPRVICSLGSPALKALKGDQGAGIIRNRGRPFRYRDIQVVPTFHPSYLLRNEKAKKPAWEDLKQVLVLIGREPPPRRRGRG